MTRAEANAVLEACNRALQILEGVKFPDTETMLKGLPGVVHLTGNDRSDFRERVHKAFAPAIDEIHRVKAMADCELSKSTKR